METDRLKYFCTIVELGGLTRAAELLGVSHSGLSKAMSVLQDEVGAQLFRPQGRGLEVTHEGLDVYKKSKDILSGLDALRIRTGAMPKSVRIGVQEAFSHSLAGAIAAALEGGVEFCELDSGEMEMHLLEKKIDFGFTFVPFPQKDVEYLKISKVSLGSFCRKGAFQNIAPEAIPYVIPSSELRDNPLSLKIRDGWNKDIPRFTPFKANNLSAALNMAQAGIAAIYIPKFLARLMNSTLANDHKLMELNMPSNRQSSEVTWREIFLIKTGKETTQMKKVAKAVRLATKE